MNALHRIYTVVVFIILASVDNIAAVLVPPLYSPIARELSVGEGRIAVVTAAGFLVSAVAAVGWAYTGDRTNRKPVLMAGTLIWAAGTAGSALAVNYLAFFGAQMLAAVGLGAVGSVGFSVVSDLISPKRRGLVMSLWGLSQGAGTLLGTSLSALLGAADWRRPFWVLTVVGLAATFAYVFTADVRRGQSEPQLAVLFESGGEYKHRISLADLKRIASRWTNVWLVLQGITAQVVFGSLVWLPRLFQAKAEAQGFDEQAAIQIGGLFATLFSLGGVLSIVGGLVGDRLQRRTPRGRALVATFGILGGIPFYVVLFFLPLPIDPSEAGGSVVGMVFLSIVTVPIVGVSFLLAFVAQACSGANAPNWYALISDVNPPEHRGTIYSAGNLANGIGRAAGNSLVSVAFRGLQAAFPPPLNYALGLALFQLFFVPTGIMYWLASRTSPKDVETVRDLLRSRAEADASDAAADAAARPPRGGS